MVSIMSKKKKKSNESKVIDRQFSENYNVKSILCIIAVILVILLLFYFLTVVLLNKGSNSITSNASIQYTKILAGESFHQKEDHYLVFFYDMSSSDASDYAGFIRTYRDKEKHLPIYTVDLHEGMNQKYLSEDDNRKATKESELKLSGPTIIEFQEGQIQDYITSSFEDYLENHVE